MGQHHAPDDGSETSSGDPATEAAAAAEAVGADAADLAMSVDGARRASAEALAAMRAVADTAAAADEAAAAAQLQLDRFALLRIEADSLAERADALGAAAAAVRERQGELERALGVLSARADGVEAMAVTAQEKMDRVLVLQPVAKSTDGEHELASARRGMSDAEAALLDAQSRVQLLNWVWRGSSGLAAALVVVSAFAPWFAVGVVALASLAVASFVWAYNVRADDVPRLRRDWRDAEYRAERAERDVYARRKSGQP